MASLIAGLQSYFRKRRNRRLSGFIDQLARRLNRPLRILDVGGRPVFWETVDTDNIDKITVINIETVDLSGKPTRFPMEALHADALDLTDFAGGKFDLVVSNSVIEHLGTWKNIKLCARELRSVADCGYVQTPSVWFPIEQHFMIPFFHWLPNQVRAILLPHLPRAGYEDVNSIDSARDSLEVINLLTGREMAFLFPDAHIDREKLLLLTKSYVAIWDAAAQPALG
jgi:hypothetical protein